VIILFVITIFFWTEDSVPPLVSLGVTILLFDMILVVIYTPLLMAVKHYQIEGKNFDPKMAESWRLPPDNAFADKVKNQIGNY
jgi:hypothetical protein